MFIIKRMRNNGWKYIANFVWGLPPPLRDCALEFHLKDARQHHDILCT